ncbi:MAG: NAD(+)/NADH kinase [Proteobacteria bacterium]|nr:NAD(+)/NADH kinase [Pseudomonadota bacterium]
MKRIGFILKPGSAESREILAELVPWLRGEGHLPVVADEDGVAEEGVMIVPREQIGTEIDLAVVLGGDGTILGANALIADRAVPILGINLGRLGFLTGFDPTEAQQALSDALAGKLGASERMRLALTYRPSGGDMVQRTALNDAVVHQGSMARLIEIETTIGDDLISVYRADGLVVCTPTGSTAHNLAAGGPILMPGQKAMAITPICAHSLTSRPLVVPAAATVSIKPTGHTRGAVLTVDGQWGHSLQPGDRIDITAAERPLLLFDSDKRYFDVLREKLHWDARPARFSEPDQPHSS